MNTPIKVSLVTVVRNGEAHIETCIKSVLAQTYPLVEYIVIDGASTDSTLSIINKYKGQIDTLVSEPDKGIADAFNKGLRLATGSITGLLNADDWLEPDAIEHVVAEINDHDILYGNMRQWTANDTQYVLTGNHHKLMDGMSLNHPAVFVKKHVYAKTGYYDTTYRLAMDYEFLLRCVLAGISFKRSDKLLTNMKTEGASDLNWLAAIKEVKRAKDTHLGTRFANRTSYLSAVLRTGISRLLLGSVFEPLFSYYRRQSKNIVKQQS